MLNSTEHDKLRQAIWSRDVSSVTRYMSWSTDTLYELDKPYLAKPCTSIVPPGIFEITGLSELNYLEEAFLSLYSGFAMQLERTDLLKQRLQICAQLVAHIKPINRNPLCSPWVLVNIKFNDTLDKQVLEILRSVLSQGFDSNTVFKLPFLDLPNSLLSSVTRQYQKIPLTYLKLLLKFGLNLDHRVEGIPLFKSAVIYGQLDVVRYLLGIERSSWQAQLFDSSGAGLIQDALDRVRGLRFHQLIAEFLRAELKMRHENLSLLHRRPEAGIRDALEVEKPEPEISKQVAERSVKLGRRY